MGNGFEELKKKCAKKHHSMLGSACYIPVRPVRIMRMAPSNAVDAQVHDVSFSVMCWKMQVFSPIESATVLMRSKAGSCGCSTKQVDFDCVEVMIG